MAEKQMLLTINDGPHGNERSYNGLRLAMNLARRPEVAAPIFLIGDGMSCAKQGQQTPDGYYNIERMIRSLAHRGEVAA